MGNRSIKEDKNIYFKCREEACLTREAAAEKMDCISADRIYKIETKSVPYPPTANYRKMSCRTQ